MTITSLPSLPCLPPLVLASASPQRRDLLESLGIRDLHIVPTHIDETPRVKELPPAYVQRLAQEKAQAARILLQEQGLPQIRVTQGSCTQGLPAQGAFILGADTIVAVGRRILQKAADVDDARAQMTLLSGRRHRVYTGVCLITPTGKVCVRLACCRVAFKRLSSQELESFLERRDWEGVCVYRLSRIAGAFISWMSGTPSTITGLPVHETAHLLEGNGYPLWSRGTQAGEV